MRRRAIGPPRTWPCPSTSHRQVEYAGHVMAQRYRAVVLACGAALFTWLVYSMGPATILESFRVLSWRLVPLIVFPGIVLKMFDALAWRYALDRKSVV